MSTIATPNQKILVGVPANSSERVLVNHPTQSATAIDGWKSVFFGLPFLAAGIFIAGAALDYIGGSKHAPNWLIGLIGFFFFAAGAFLIIHGLRGVAQKSKYDSEARTAPHEPWLYDHLWQREGIAFSAFNTMLQRFVAALVWNAFLIPFFWIGLTQRGAWVCAIFAGLFALVGLVFLSRWAQMLAELLRYGNSFLDYNSFPYFLGSTMSGRLRAPNHLADIDELTLTLRCVQERYITSGSGDNRSTKVVCFELYSDSQTLSRVQLAAYSNHSIPVEFTLPESQPTTSLTSTPPTYWEIEANGKSSKVNLQAFFLVPVYKPRS
jgi:hypothetical protein